MIGSIRVFLSGQGVGSPGDLGLDDELRRQDAEAAATQRKSAIWLAATVAFGIFCLVTGWSTGALLSFVSAAAVLCVLVFATLIRRGLSGKRTATG